MAVRKEESKVNQIKLSEEQMQAAIQRATESAKNWVQWKDPKAQHQDKPSSR